MITIFSFGYWGWGNATRQLVEVIDLAERARGFRPPIFIDIRVHRKVRALGFVDDAFRDLVGAARYQHMKDLGNQEVAIGGKGIRIKHPEAAAELLDTAVRADRERRRVIFYCACEFPWVDGKRRCHRDAVTELLLREAKRSGHAISVVEWPGGEPVVLDEPLEVDRKLFAAVMSGRRFIPLEHQRLAAFAGLPWGSILTFKCDGRTELLAVGPPNCASFKGNRYWRLPLCVPAQPGKQKASLLREVLEWRRRRGLHERYEHTG